MTPADPSSSSTRPASTRPSRGLRRVPVRAEPGGRALDALGLGLVLVGLALCLRATSRFGLAPSIGLILPGLRLVGSKPYRTRALAFLGRRLAEVSAFANGGGPVPWLAAVVFVAIPFFLIDASNGRTLGAVDTKPVMMTAASLVRDGDLDVSEFGRDGRSSLLLDRIGRLLPCFQRTGSGIYSAFPPGMLPFAAPVAGLARLVGTDLDSRLVLIRLEKVAASATGGLVVALFFLNALCLGPPRAAAVATALLASGSAIFTTVGLGMWQHGGVSAWLLAALLVELKTRGTPTPRGVIAQGIACGMLLTCRPTAAVLVVGFGLWVLLRSPKRAVAMASVAVVAYLPCEASI